jgi:MFS family permease
MSGIREFLSSWRIALLSGLVLGSVFGLLEGFSLFAISFSQDLALDRAQAAGIYSASLLASTVAAPVAGRLIDAIGPEKSIIWNFPVLILSLALCGSVTEIWQMYLLYALPISWASTILVLSSQVAVNRGYPLRRGTALGIAYSGVGVGNFLLFNALSAAIARLGWEWAYVTAAMVATCSWIGYCLGLFQGHLFGRKFGESELVEDQKIARLSDVKLAETMPPTKPPGERSVFRLKYFWYILVAAVAASILDFIIFQHLAPFLVQSGYSQERAGFMLSLASLGYVAGQLGAGALSDRIGREPVGLGAAALFLISLWLCWNWTQILVVALSAVTLGLCIGAIIGCRSATTGDLFSDAGLGKISGQVHVASAIGAAFGTWVGGVGVDQTGSYRLTFLVAVLCALLWCQALWLAAPRRVANRDTAARA